MVFNTIVSWVVGALGIVISLLPDVDPTTIATISGYNSQFRDALANINWFFPVDTALFFLSLIFAIQLSIFGWHILRYITGVLTAGILK